MQNNDRKKISVNACLFYIHCHSFEFDSDGFLSFVA